MSERTDILNSIKTTLQSIVEMKHVELDRATPPDWETQVMPAAFIYQGEEARDTEDSVIGQETWNWEIFIEVVGKNSELEAVLQLIHNAMYANYKLDDAAVLSYRTGSTFYYIDPEKQLKSMVLSYIVRYDHTQGAL